MIDDEEDSTTLFPYPDVAMCSGMFLPLDELMDHPEHMEPDRFIPAVVEAGGKSVIGWPDTLGPQHEVKRAPWIIPGCPTQCGRAPDSVKHLVTLL